MKKLLLSILIISSGCSVDIDTELSEEKISIEFDEGLHEESKYRLTAIDSEFFVLPLWKGSNQTIQRITGKVITVRPNDKSTITQIHKVSFESNLYWWLKPGDTVATITKTYFNEFTGELVYSELPPIINWKEALIPTINPAGYTNPETGSFSVVIAPILKMKNDTLKVTAKVVSQKGEEISKSVKIILR
jgi:hypothetical protein